MTKKTLKTERLTLRPVAATDAAAIASLAADYDIARMTTRIPHPCSLTDALDWLDELEQSGEAAFVILHQDNVIGATSYTPLKGTRAEIGYWIGKPWWGHGFATEAVGALLDHAFEAGACEIMLAGHFSDNPASGRVLEKLGFEHTHDEDRYSTARGETVLSREFQMTNRDRLRGSDAGDQQASP